MSKNIKPKNIHDIINVIIDPKEKEKEISLKIDLWDLSIIFLIMQDLVTDIESENIIEDIDKNDFDYKINKIKIQDLFKRIWETLEKNIQDPKILPQIISLSLKTKLDLICQLNNELRELKGEISSSGENII